MDDQNAKKNINILYGTLIVSTVLSFVPNTSAFLLSMALILAVLICAYYYKAKDTQDGLLYNHMVYMIGTIWIGSAFFMISILLVGLAVYLKGDQSVIFTTMDSIQGGLVPSQAEIQAISYQYMLDNKGLLLTASAVAVGPAILYFVYRVANGMSRAWKGYRIANPKSWL